MAYSALREFLMTDPPIVESYVHRARATAERDRPGRQQSAYHRLRPSRSRLRSLRYLMSGSDLLCDLCVLCGFPHFGFPHWCFSRISDFALCAPVTPLCTVFERTRMQVTLAIILHSVAARRQTAAFFLELTLAFSFQPSAFSCRPERQIRTYARSMRGQCAVNARSMRVYARLCASWQAATKPQRPRFQLAPAEGYGRLRKLTEGYGSIIAHPLALL